MIDIPNSLSPPRRLTFGITGHRLNRLCAENVTLLEQAVDDFFARVAFASGTDRSINFRIVSALAEGADAILADHAIRKGWQLDVVLPFERDVYADDFTETSARQDYERHLAASYAVMELQGHRDDADGASAAYERAGRVVLSQSDILIALWDGGPARGRGGAQQIIAEAVLAGIPVVHIDPAARHAPMLLWNGLDEVDLGQQTLETVARHDLSALPDLIERLTELPSAPTESAMLRQFENDRLPRWNALIAYPLLLTILGVRRLRLSDLRRPKDDGKIATLPVSCATSAKFALDVSALLSERFARADAIATRTAQVFRSVYVTNFALAAMAVVLSLLSLALPAAAKPALITLELLTIGAILALTRAGNRAGWHRRWLDNRMLAERVRCLAISSQLGDLNLRVGGDIAIGWVDWYVRATARQVGLPSACIDADFLRCVRADLTDLIEAQIAYLSVDAHRMHRLEHRLHTLGTLLFGLTGLTCVGMLIFKLTQAAVGGMEEVAHALTIAATIVSASLPAIGAAIYGIRMQGDFAGIAERSHALADRLSRMRDVIAQDDLSFDTLRRRIRRVADLLADDLTSWLQTYHARPLVLPG
ncbi:MAG: hypothetical protein K2P68_09695 [Sphingomonas sp.]|nr:hypothetical protein [Sphingomonas sp.]